MNFFQHENQGENNRVHSKLVQMLHYDGANVIAYQPLKPL